MVKDVIWICDFYSMICDDNDMLCTFFWGKQQFLKHFYEKKLIISSEKTNPHDAPTMKYFEQLLSVPINIFFRYEHFPEVSAMFFIVGL